MPDASDSKPRADTSPQSPRIDPWLGFAISKLGVYEAPGAADNPSVVAFHGATRGGEAPDSVPWCSSFANWCFLAAGISGTRTKRARDWVEKPPKGFVVSLGANLDHARLGDVVVLRRGSNPNQGHVTFFFGHAAQKGFLGLGGNQGNEVGVDRYLVTRVLGYVRYVGE